MKNLVILLSVLFLFSLTSCSDVNNSSLLTNPVMEKSNLSTIDEITPPTVYPYPYLYNFLKVNDLTYLTVEGENAIHFNIPEGTAKFGHFFVVVNFVQGIEENFAPKMYFIDQFSETTFKIDGIRVDQVQTISVYGFALNIASQGTCPFINNSAINEVAVKGWKLEKSNILVECSGIWPSSLKYVFAEINSKAGSCLVFLQKPYSTSFIVPEYGKFGVEGIQLFGYQTVMEGDVATF